MSDDTPSIEDSWFHTTAEIAAHGLSAERIATIEQRRALAVALDIIAIEQLDARYTIEPLPQGRYRLSGELKAKVAQACVVTLDPVVSDIDEQLAAEFWPPSAILEGGEG